MKSAARKPSIRDSSSDRWFDEVLSSYQMSIPKTFRFRPKLTPEFIRLARDRHRIPVLLPVLMDWEHYPIKIWEMAESALAARREDARITAYLAKNLAGPSLTQRRRAAKTLCRLVPQRAAVLALRHARHSSDHIVRCYSLHAALVLAMKNRRLRPEVVRLAKRAAKGRTRTEKMTGLNCLEIFGNLSTAAIFRDAMNDRDPLVRMTAKNGHDDLLSRKKDTLKRK